MKVGSGIPVNAKLTVMHAISGLYYMFSWAEMLHMNDIECIGASTLQKVVWLIAVKRSC
jgi:hypothetical protein